MTSMAGEDPIVAKLHRLSELEEAALAEQREQTRTLKEILERINPFVAPVAPGRDLAEVMRRRRDGAGGL